MNSKIFIYLSLLYLLHIGCNTVDNNLIYGQWKATSVSEEGKPLAVDEEQIQFHFFSDDRYVYQSTLNYKEAGSFFVEGQYLHTTDTIHQASRAKVVEIIQLTADSLSFKMMDQGKERVLKMIKVN